MMKRLKKTKYIGSVALFAVLALTLSSCLKDGDEEPEMVAAMLAVNVVPGSDGLVLALDNNQFNHVAAGEWFAYRNIINYRRVFPGERLVRLFHPENVASNEEILRKSVDFDVSEFYSLFVVGTSDEDMEVVVVADSLRSPASGTARVRFANMSADAPALELGIEGRSDLLAGPTPFKGHSDYVVLDADETYQVFIRRAGNDEVVHTFEFKPQNRYIYTICTRGFYEGTDPDAATAFGHGVIVH